MHPIISAGAWTLPKDIQDIHEVEVNRVFNFAPDRQHTIIINGVTCAALGHHLKGYTWHPFWGNWDLVVGCMRRIDENGFEDGLVEIAGTEREDGTSTACRFKGVDGRLLYLKLRDMY